MAVPGPRSFHMNARSRLWAQLKADAQCCSKFPRSVCTRALRKPQHCLSYFLVLEGETLLLKMPHTLDTGLGGFKTKLTWKPPPYRLSHIVSEGSMKAAKREEQLVVPLRCKQMNHHNENDWACKMGP